MFGNFIYLLEKKHSLNIMNLLNDKLKRQNAVYLPTVKIKIYQNK